MKKVFSILLALALLAIAGTAMAENQLLKKYQHTPCEGDIVKVDATCTSEGIGLHPYDKPFKNVVISDDMSVTYVGEQKFWSYSIPMKAHTYEWVCTEVAECDGCYTLVETCSVCKKTTGKTMTLENEDNHVWGAWQVVTAPTCTKTGLKYHICFHCNIRAWEVMPVVDHDWEAYDIKSATCTEEGLRGYRCATCYAADKTVVKKTVLVSGSKTPKALTEVIPALGHQIDKNFFIVTKAPKCFDKDAYAAGTKTFTEAMEGVKGEGFYPCVRKANGHYCCMDIKKDTKDGITCKDVTADYTDADGNQYVIGLVADIDPIAHEWDYLYTLPARCEVGSEDVSQCLACKNYLYEEYEDALGHDWSEWEVMNAYEKDVTLGYWVRHCLREIVIKVPGQAAYTWVCNKNDDYVGKDPAAGESENYGGLMNIEGQWVMTKKDGTIDTKFNGLTNFEGGKFLIVDGYLSDKNGLWLNPATNEFIYLANGQVQDSYEGLVLYDGEWFFIANGKVATNVCGLKAYDGAEFVVANGQVLTNLNGLWLDVDTNNWYYIAAGKKAPYTGLALYDGAWFYVTNGQLDTTFCGEVEYDGATFTVVNGMLVK